MSDQSESRPFDELARQQLVIYAKELQQLYQENRWLRAELQRQGPGVVAPGSRIGRYEIREEIGEGGTAVVFKAYDPDLNREVAVKVLHRRRSGDPNFANRFRREAKAVANLNHSNILQVYDYGEIQGSAYIVTNYVKGGTLPEHLGKPLKSPAVLRYAYPLADALDYAHGRGIVHRDVKPTNILLEADDTPVLADFGIAKIMTEGVDPTVTKWTMGLQITCRLNKCRAILWTTDRTFIHLQ